MSKRTRISSKIDAQRLSSLVSRPGIDPRVWFSLCVVDAVTVEGANGPDGSGGVFADVHIMSTSTLDDDGNTVAQKETVRVSPAYAGNGFGLFFPPAVGDEVVVAWADGDPDHGGMLISRAWSASDPPPQLAINNPNDALLMIAKDANLRIVCQGQGNVVLQVDKGKVLLGGETDAALDALALATKANSNFNLLFNLLDSIFGAASAPLATVFPGTDAAYTALHAAIVALAAQWRMQDVSTQKVKGE